MITYSVQVTSSDVIQDIGEIIRLEKAHHLSEDLISQFNPQLLPHRHLNLESESQFNQ